jgi:hypothetical protein
MLTSLLLGRNPHVHSQTRTASSPTRPPLRPPIPLPEPTRFPIFTLSIPLRFFICAQCYPSIPRSLASSLFSLCLSASWTNLLPTPARHCLSLTIPRVYFFCFWSRLPDIDSMAGKGRNLRLCESPLTFKHIWIPRSYLVAESLMRLLCYGTVRGKTIRLLKSTWSMSNRRQLVDRSSAFRRRHVIGSPSWPLPTTTPHGMM